MIPEQDDQFIRELGYFGVSLICGFLGFLALFGLRYALASLCVTVICGGSGILRWGVYKTNMAVFIIAVVFVFAPQSVQDRVLAAAQGLVARVETFATER